MRSSVPQPFWICLACALAAALGALPSHAREGTDPPSTPRASKKPKAPDTFEAQPIVVRPASSPPSTGPADAVAFATVLHPGERAHRRMDLADLLREAVGVDVRGFGGLGGFATLSIRGSTSDQVPIFLDGVLLSRAMGGGFNLGDVPLAHLERIEVYRGLTPTRFGAAAPGGVVNLVTREGARSQRTMFSATYGSFGTFEVAASHAGPHDRGDYLASIFAQRTDGNFAFLDNNGTPLNAIDDELVRRRNNHATTAGGLVKTRVRVGERDRIGTTFEGMLRMQGVAGIDAIQSERARFDTHRVFVKLDWERTLVAPFPARIEVRGFATHTRDAFRDDSGELGLAPRSVTTSAFTPGLTALLRLFPDPHHALTAMLEYRHDAAASDTRVFGRAALTDLGRHALALSLEDELSFLSGRVTFNPSFRFDALRSDARGAAVVASTHAEVSAKVGLRVALTKELSLRGNVGRFFRPPSLVELFGDSGVVRGNPALRPELGYTMDTGLTFERRGTGFLRRVFGEVAYFQSHYSELILFVLNGQGVAVADNLSAALIRGVELHAAADLALGASIRAAYTFQRAEDRSAARTAGNLLPGRPQHKLAVRAGLRRGPLRLFYDLTVIDGNFVDRLNRVLLDARILHAAGVAVRVLPEIVLSLEVSNFTDNRVVDVYRFPLPGRSVFGKLAAIF
jgi:iron complex outermembrane receptor protein